MVRTGEKLLSMSEARKVIADKTGRRVSLPTIWRWAMHGIRGVRLAHARVGRELRTSEGALDRFYAELAMAYSTGQATADPVFSSAHAQAEAELNAA